jgi:hypothetical protein
MATKDDEEMIDAFEGTEPYANDYTFHRWCEHLFILNNEMSKQEIFDAYYLRAYFIVLYELSNEGLNYAKKQEQQVPDKRYNLLVKMVEEMFQEITDDEYFLIKYFRDSYCHIFTRSYDYHNEDGTVRKGTNFYCKDGVKYCLTPREIMEKFVATLGIKPDGELLFKKRIFNTYNPIIKKYELLFTSERKRINAPLNDLKKMFDPYSLLEL